MTGHAERVETAIIGGGHVGLTMSYSLNQLRLERVILERGQVGERWRSERWDSFHFQFPNWTIELPGFKYTSIVWATGFRNDFGWVKLPIFDNAGDRVHRPGVTSLPGIYFLGLRWLYRRKSYFLAMAGHAEDAAYLAEHIKNRAKLNWS